MLRELRFNFLKGRIGILLPHQAQGSQSFILVMTVYETILQEL